VTNLEKGWLDFKRKYAAAIDIRNTGNEHVTWKPEGGRNKAFAEGYEIGLAENANEVENLKRRNSLFAEKIIEKNKRIQELEAQLKINN